MVARMVRDHEAMGSNPVTPTKTAKFRRFCGFFMLFFLVIIVKTGKLCQKIVSDIVFRNVAPIGSLIIV